MGIRFESCKKTSDAFKELCENVFTRRNALGSLLNVKHQKDLRQEEIERILAERKTPMPAKITFAGENTYKIYISLSLAQESRRTILTPPETVAENALRTFTVGPNHFANLSSPLRDLSNSRT